MKKIILLTMLLIMSSMVVADNYSFKEINTIPTCVGEVVVKVENYNNATDFSIAGCETHGDLWKCSCNEKDTSIYLKTNNDLSYSLDIITEYYINKTNSSFNNETTDNDLKYKSTEQFNDFILGIVEEPPEPIDPPTKQDWIFFAVLFGLIIGVLGLASIFFIKWLLTDNESDCDFTTSFRKNPREEVIDVKQEQKVTVSNEENEIQNILDSL